MAILFHPAFLGAASTGIDLPVALKLVYQGILGYYRAGLPWFLSIVYYLLSVFN
ncbi:MAG: hypothetical protein V4560_05115 [Bacteroidota bacterium]